MSLRLGRGTTVAVTGASGLLGRRLCEHFQKLGCTVHALLRRPDEALARAPGIKSFECDLPSRVDPKGFAGVDAVVHAAYTTRHVDRNTARRVNEDGSARVLSLARWAGVERFVFVSSLTAGPDAQSYYGKSKHQVERTLDWKRDMIVRPGLILGAGGGLYGRMRDAIARTGTAPIFDGGRQIVQTIHIDDLCLGVRVALERGYAGPLNLAEPNGPTMRELLELIGTSVGRRVRFISLPSTPMLPLLRLAELLRIQLPITSENLLGLRSLRRVPTEGAQRHLFLYVRPAAESVAALSSVGVRKAA